MTRPVSESEAARLTVYEVDGVTLAPVRYEAPITEREAEEAQRVIAFGACIDSINCRLRWRGRAEMVRA